MAPFNRYRTLDVIRGVVAAGGRGTCHALYRQRRPYRADLLAPFTLMREGRLVSVRIKGGLLGHWSVWTKRAVELLARSPVRRRDREITPELLALDGQVTDCNSALFDVAHDFRAASRVATRCCAARDCCKASGAWTGEGLSPARRPNSIGVRADYPHLVDDIFVAEHVSGG
jgi:hypothetical protein